MQNFLSNSRAPVVPETKHTSDGTLLYLMLCMQQSFDVKPRVDNQVKDLIIIVCDNNGWLLYCVNLSAKQKLC